MHGTTNPKFVEVNYSLLLSSFDTFWQENYSRYIKWSWVLGSLA